MNLYVDKLINMAFYTKPLSQAQEDFILAGYTPENAQELIRVATKKKVLPVVGKLMSRLGVDAQFWEEQYRFFEKRNQEITRLMAEVFQAFTEAGVTRICAFENYGAMLAADTDIALNSSGDVDLYAQPDQKEQIVQVLAGFGYKPAGNVADQRNIMTEFTAPDAIVCINVAWKPLRRYALPMKADTARYFDWENMGFYKDTAIRLPSLETFLYLCFLRVAVHGYSRSPDIRLYIDTYNATRNDPNWETVMGWAKADGMTTKIVTVAAIAQDLIGIDVPDFVLEQAKCDPDCQKILDIAYDFENHTLRYDPSGLQLIRLEAASDNLSVAALLLQMLFPSSDWLSEYYLTPGEKAFKKYINYYKHLL